MSRGFSKGYRAERQRQAAQPKLQPYQHFLNAMAMLVGLPIALVAFGLCILVVYAVFTTP